MSDNLKDPNKPAHAIIEVRDDGTALRNDGEELQAANSNPWYVLATVFGEQAEGAEIWNYDKKLAAKNRRAWNGWACAGLSEVERQDRAEKVGLAVRYLQPLTEVELAEVTRRFKDRMVGDAELPSKTETINFSKTYFSRPLIFQKYVLEKDANFVSAIFSGYAYFGSATFNGYATFVSATFSGYAIFDSATFSGGATFSSATFNGGATFGSATFSGDAYFDSATFSGGATFGSATFSGIANFDTSTFSGRADFNSTAFSGDADFSSAKFKSTTRFDKAKFLSSVPQFHGAELFDDTTFTLPENYRKNWPPIDWQKKDKKQDKPIKVMPAPDQKRAYNRLRLFMNRALQFDEEQFFHRQEMRCKAVSAKYYHKPFYWLYSWFSDYGNSVWRPLVGMGVLILIGAVANLWLQGHLAALCLQTANYWENPRKALGWSVSNTLPLLGFGKLYYGGAYAANLPFWLKIVGGVQMLFGYILLFLLGLGLRNRFRLR